VQFRKFGIFFFLGGEELLWKSGLTRMSGRARVQTRERAEYRPGLEGLFAMSLLEIPLRWHRWIIVTSGF